MRWYSFFSSENPVWKPFAYIADILFLSFMWLLCSIPLFTLGASGTALYDSVAHGFCLKEKDIYQRFFRTFKRELAASVPSTLLWGLILGLCYLGLRSFVFSAAPTDSSYVLAVAGLLLLICAAGIFCWVFPLLSRFTFGFISLNVTALKLAFKYLPISLAMGLSLWLCLYLCVSYLYPVFVLTALMVYLWELMLEPVFRKYSDSED